MPPYTFMPYRPPVNGPALSTTSSDPGEAGGSVAIGDGGTSGRLIIAIDYGTTNSGKLEI
jgi:hypothetical protein